MYLFNEDPEGDRAVEAHDAYIDARNAFVAKWLFYLFTIILVSFALTAHPKLKAGETIGSVPIRSYLPSLIMLALAALAFREAKAAGKERRAAIRTYVRNTRQPMPPPILPGIATILLTAALAVPSFWLQNMLVNPEKRPSWWPGHSVQTPAPSPSGVQPLEPSQPSP